MTAELPDRAVQITYEDLPYGSRPIAPSHPDVLFVQATLAGLSPVDPREARVLELGCAEGTNLFPIAARYAGARFVGVDMGARHIQAGLEVRDRLGLDNVELIRADVVDFAPLEGGFDYVLCHGVFSWVTEAVADRILAVIRAALSPRGVAFLSYNVSAGWGLRRELRQALLRRTRGSEGPEVAVAHVRGLLSFLGGNPLADSAHATMLAAEAKSALVHGDAYLAHEFLSPENRPYRYSEVEARARGHQLTIVDELSLLGEVTTADQIAEVLSGIAEDTGEREDLLDLLYGRAFRMSLLAREDAPRGEVGPARARPLFFGARVVPESKHLSFEPGDSELFRSPDGVRVAVENPWLKAALAELARSAPHFVPFPDVLARATELLRLRRAIAEDASPSAEEVDRVAEDLLELQRLHHVVARATPLPTLAAPSRTPRATTLARLEARRFGWVTDAQHRPIRTGPLEIALLGLLDGARDLETLVAQLDERLQAAGVPVHDEKGGELDPARRTELLREEVARAVTGFAELGVLER